MRIINLTLVLSCFGGLLHPSIAQEDSILLARLQYVPQTNVVHDEKMLRDIGHREFIVARVEETISGPILASKDIIVGVWLLSGTPHSNMTLLNPKEWQIGRRVLIIGAKPEPVDGLCKPPSIVRIDVSGNRSAPAYVDEELTRWGDVSRVCPERGMIYLIDE